MTIEVLEQYRGLMSEIKAIDAEINALYDVRRSPNGREPGGNGSTPTAPTERAVARILELQEKRARLMKDWERKLKDIEAWLDSVNDADIRSIIRWHYVLGFTWKRTSREVFGADNYYRARKKIYRYFEKN
jgi:hypothetical protein